MPRTLLILLLLATACRREVPVLLWHEVGCGTRDPRDVPADEFERELSWLADDGRTVVPATALLEPAKLPRKPVVVTFDDGAACIYRAAFPILRRRGLPFTVFLPASWIGADEAHRTTQPLGDGEQVPTMIWPELLEMGKSGLCTVGAHGETHLYLRRASEAELRRELVDAKAELSERLGSPVTLLAYPFGSFNRAVIAEARKAGYREAFSVGVGLGGAFAYRRRSIHRGADRAGFEEALSDRWIWPLLNHDP